MSYQNIAKAKAIERKNKERLLEVNPKLDDESGIYFLTREDENGIRYFYIGQAKSLIQRMCGHLVGYQHIDLSLKKEDLQPKAIRMVGNLTLFIIRYRSLISGNNTGFWNTRKKVINADITKLQEDKEKGKHR